MTYWNGTRWLEDEPATTPPPRSRRRRILGAAAEAALITTLVFGLIASSAFAAKGGNGGKPDRGSQSASCKVSPDPVAVGDDYTLVATELGAGAIVNILVSDSMGTASFNVQADANGTASLVWHAYWAGESSVSVQQQVRRKMKTLAACSFMVS